MVTTEQLRKYIDEKKVTIGATQTIRALKAGSLKTVVLASNAPAVLAGQVERLQTLKGVNLERLTVGNDELGTMCKKPFAISILGIK